MSTSIIAIDPGTKLGFAIRREGYLLQSGTKIFNVDRGESPGMRWIRFETWLNEMIGHAKTEEHRLVIAHEQSHNRGGAATAIAAGWETIIQKLAAYHGADVMIVRSSTLKKHAGERGAKLPGLHFEKVIVKAKGGFMMEKRKRIKGEAGATKLAMKAAAEDLFQRPCDDDNESDALWVLDYAMKTVGEMK